MKIMASWMTLDYLQGARTIRGFIDSSGKKQTSKFTYRNPFGLNFKYRHQVDDDNNHRHVPIYLKMTWATKFCPGRKIAWYLAVSEVNIALASGHFQNYGVLQPSLDFFRAFSIDFLYNIIWVEFGDNV